MKCRKLHGKFDDQKMSDLPKERCSEAAFSLIVVWTCLGYSSSEREGPILSNIEPYSPVLQVEQYILR